MKKLAPPPDMNILCLNDLLPPKKRGMKKKKIPFLLLSVKSQHSIYSVQVSILKI